MSTASTRLHTITSHLTPSPTAAAAGAQQQRQNDNDVLLLGLARTPIGTLHGALSSLTAPQLAAHAITAALAQAHIQPHQVEECIFGNVLSAGIGQAPARQAAMAAGLPVNVVCSTVNKVCASGMHSVKLGAQQIQLGVRDVVLCGGMESMSNAPFYTQRQLPKLGNTSMVDGMQFDGLYDPYSLTGMGVAGELCAQKYKISREQQDAYAIQSFQRAQHATSTGIFQREIVPITVKRGGKQTTVKHDEGPSKIDLKRVPALKASFPTKPTRQPVFAAAPADLQNDTHNPYSNASGASATPTGTVTAANASQISDGAAAVVLISRRKANELGLLKGLKDVIVLCSYSDAETHPLSFPVSPSLAIPVALQRAKLSKDQIDAWEINEAFAVVVLANQQLVGIPNDRVNIYGGGVSLGHPIGCSGARILVTLSTALRQNNWRYGCAAICNGGGGSSAMVVERQSLQ